MLEIVLDVIGCFVATSGRYGITSAKSQLEKYKIQTLVG